MKKQPLLAALLSLIVPGAGQIYAGRNHKGAIIIFAAIVIANLNILILPLIAMANPVLPAPAGDPRALWAYWIPRIVHDVASLWCIVFWMWVVADAYRVAKRYNKLPDLWPGKIIS